MAFGKDFKFGEKTTGNGVPKFKLVDGENKFITILDINDTIVSRTHYIQPLGYFNCWQTIDDDGIVKQGSCCKAIGSLPDGNPKCGEKLILPVAIYTPTGKNTCAPPVQFARLELTSKAYDQLVRALEEEEVTIEEAVTKVIKVTGVASGTGKFAHVAMEFRVKGTSLIKSDPSLKVQAQEFLAKYNETIKDSLGKTITEAKLFELIDDLNIVEGEITENEPNTAPKTQNLPDEKMNFPVIEEDEFDYDGIDLNSVLDDEFMND